MLNICDMCNLKTFYRILLHQQVTYYYPFSAMNDLFILSEDCKTILSVTDKNIKNIVIPKDVTKIGNSAFEFCDYLEAIEIPNGVMEIGEEAFYGCSALKSIILPNSVTEIGQKAFEHCSSLKVL